MRLHIRMLCAEKRFGSFTCQILNDINILTAAVIPFSGVSLGIFIGQHAAGGCQCTDQSV